MIEDDAKLARESAIVALSRREHSWLELKTKLTAKGFDAVCIEAELGRLIDEGLLSDRRFAEAYINYRVGRGYGPIRIKTELNQRGIDDGLAKSVFDDLAIDWAERITTVWQKKFAAAAEDYRTHAKQARFLQYRGFTHEQISRVLPNDY